MRILCIAVVALFLSGCGTHWSDQMIKEIEKWGAAEFSNGRLCGYSTYGFDASFLNGRLLRYAKEKRDEFRGKRFEDIPKGDVAVFFSSLVFSRDAFMNIKPHEAPCFRLQYGAVKTRKDEGKSFFADPVKKSFTFFFVTKTGEVHVLCVDCSRNPMSSHWSGGRDFAYGGRDVRIGIWDAHMPDRNRPEKILDGEYEDMFGIVSDSPFNYLPYLTPRKARIVKSMHGDSVLKPVWRTSECMIFIPGCLLGDDESELPLP